MGQKKTNKTFLIMFKKKNEQPEDLSIKILGQEVERFLTQHEIKSLYIRTATHFGSTQFVRFKKVS